MDSESSVIPDGFSSQTSTTERRNGSAHSSYRSSATPTQMNARPATTTAAAHRRLFDRIAPDLRAWGIELDYREIDVPSFDIGTRRFDENGDPLPTPLPMSLADALHPREGDKLAASPLHFFFIISLFELARLRFGSDPSFLWLTDTEFDLTSIDHGVIRPDISLLLDVVNQRDLTLARFFLDKELEDHPPRLVLAVEVTSRSTRQNDFIDKLVMYGDAGFEQYIVIDIYDKGQIQILDFRPTISYKPLDRRADGRTLIESLNVWVETAGENLAFTDAETGERIADYPQAIEQLETMTRQRDRARRIAKNARRKVKTAEQAKFNAERQAQNAREMLELLVAEGKCADLDPETAQRLRQILEDQPDPLENPTPSEELKRRYPEPCKPRS